ncbi:MAG: hypothetical protein OEX02_19685 [Cyclobacteriaceae bacterium]|nr:hypothetical protein [Cyclobacteriaceae bacterium]
MIKTTLYILCVSLLLTCFACEKEDPPAANYPLTFTFSHQVNGQALETNNLAYTNAAGNTFSVEKLQYIISNIELVKANGDILLIDDYHFIDIADQASLSFSPDTTLSKGDYKGIRLTFGLNEDQNTSGVYPELNALSWSWPDMLGGGYHFMKLEGKFEDNQGGISPFTTHMGTAREITATDTLFHANHVELILPEKAFTVGGATAIELIMDLGRWYDTPRTWNLDTLAVMIMPNYMAQKTLHENAHNVLSVGQINTH